MFSVRNTPKKFEKTTMTVIFGFSSEENSARQVTHDSRDVMVFDKLYFPFCSARPKIQRWRFQIPSFEER